MRHADIAVVVTNPEVSSVRDSDRIIGLLDAKTEKAEKGERIEKHLLLTRYDAGRADRGDMLKVEDVLEILSIPLLGIVPESMDVLRASNLGTPVTLADADSAPAQRLSRRGPPAGRRDGADDHPGGKAGAVRQDLRTEGRMSIFRFFNKDTSAPKARERLQVLLAHERASAAHSNLVAQLREEILAVIAKHVQVDRDKVNVKMDRGEKVSTLEVDIEIPLDAGMKAA